MEINPVKEDGLANTFYFNFQICSKHLYLHYVTKATAQTFMTATKHGSSCADVSHKNVFKKFANPLRNICTEASF